MDYEQIANTVSESLTQMGFYRKTAGGDVKIRFSDIQIVNDKYMLMSFDILHLPPRVRLENLTNPDTLHQLSTVCGGRKIQYINTNGLAYCIHLQSNELPTTISLTNEQPLDYMFPVPIGVSRGGPVWKDLNDLGHILIGGVTTTGKTSFLKSIIGHVGKNPKAEILVIDPKKVGFISLQSYISKPIASTIAEAEILLNYVLGELEKRKTYYSQNKIEDFRQYTGPDKLILLIVDEFTSIALLAGLDSPFFNTLKLLIIQAAAFGIHIILSTQQPKAECLPTVIRSQLDTRVCFRVATKRDSIIVLDEAGGEQIQTKGRFIFRFAGRSTLMQGYLYSVDSTFPNPLQREMIEYAIEKLYGKFPLEKVHTQFKDRISFWELQTMAAYWESVGYLEKTGQAKNSARVVTELLRNCLKQS